MLLGRLICERIDELRADLMETYGICLDEAMEGRFSPSFIASLTSQCPDGCRWRVSYDEDALWTIDRTLTALLINQFRLYIWANADKKKRGKRPAPIGPKWLVEDDSTKRLKAIPMTKEQLLAELAKPRREDA